MSEVRSTDAAATERIVVVSFYMENIRPDVVRSQRDVVRQMLPPDAEFLQIPTKVTHAEAIDAFMAFADYDVLVLLDIDCIPLNEFALPHLIDLARDGCLVGCAQRANHIENGGHIYAGPFCCAFRRSTWELLGRPSFAPTERGDVGEELTYAAEASSVDVKLLLPSSVNAPRWILFEDVRFGFGTTYSAMFFHQFGLRTGRHADGFRDKCAELMAGLEPARSRKGTLHDTGAVETPPPNSDKFYWHQYMPAYEEAFARLGPVGSILEFGVLGGQSIAWLLRRFPEARVVGANIVPQRPSWPTDPRVQYLRIDQGDRDGMASALRDLGTSFDLIIEDGSHIPQHQVSCLVEAFDLLNPGGLYILEDVHTSHPGHPMFERAHQGGARHAPNAMNVLLAFQHLQEMRLDLTVEMARDLSHPAFFAPDEVVRLYDRISGVKLYRRTSLPKQCYSCGSSQFDYARYRCVCGVQLFGDVDSMSFMIWRRTGD